MSQITVVKCGGNAAVDPVAVCRDLAWLRSTGGSVVLVHGGSADIDRLAARLGVPQRRLRAPDGVTARHTDKAMLEVVQLALAGVVKPRLVRELTQMSAPAVGLTGMDGGLVGARRKTAIRAVVDGRVVVVRDNHSGRISHVNAALLRALLAAGVVPVLSPPAVAEDGAPVNVDADRMAAAVAAAVGASTLVMLTGAPGILRAPSDETSVMTVCEVVGGRVDAPLSGGMVMKAHAGEQALRAGVRRVIVADGRVASPIRAALDGAGTVLALAADTVEAGR